MLLETLRVIGLTAALMLSSIANAFGFGELVGACEPDCTKCHQLTSEEAGEVIKKLNPVIDVLDVVVGPVRGLWEIVVEAEGKKDIAYLDFSKKHIIIGSIVNADTKDNLTKRRLYEISKVNISTIPLDDALLLGSAEAKKKIVVFDDPE